MKAGVKLPFKNTKNVSYTLQILMVCDGVQSCKGTASFLKNRSPLPNFALKVMEMKASTFAIIDLNRNLS